MFGKGCKSSVSRIETVIGENTAIDGAVTFSGGLHIDGRIKGDVTAEAGKEAMLTVSEQGSVEGNIKVPNLVLNGRVTGDVHVTDRLEMAAHAKVQGDVYYRLLEMALGAEVNGSLVHCGEPQRRKTDAATENGVVGHPPADGAEPAK